MKVILNQTVPKVGKEGTVVNVADGFARNYLFPRGLAVLADKKQIGALEKRNARVAERTAGLKSSAEGLKDLINGQTVRIPGKVGKDSTKLFGAVTSQDVVDAVKAQLDLDIDKKQVALIEPIKRLGTHEVELDLHREVESRLHVEVYDPNAIVEPAKVEAPVAEAPEPAAV
ncbi:MAG TPA: 50S ribosomal protein L9 [Fimbriimonadaceae bacterium]|nr:50S ribosomal protein L9 [Fimbriimonadaceae bacterium]